jgi:hypothetical protein
MKTLRTLTASALLVVASVSLAFAYGGDGKCCTTAKNASAKKAACCTTEKAMAKKEGKKNVKPSLEQATAKK